MSTYEQSTYEQIDHDPLPARPRRRLVTPLSAGLVAVAIAAGGFIAGVEVQKSQQTSTSAASTGAAPAFAQRAGGFPGGGQNPGGGGTQSGPRGLTAGTVASKRGKGLYVKDSSGNTVRVRTTSSSKVTRTDEASVKGVHPGDTVIVQGSTGKDGTVTATRITATSKAAGGSGGFGGLGFSGAPPGGATGP